MSFLKKEKYEIYCQGSGLPILRINEENEVWLYRNKIYIKDKIPSRILEIELNSLLKTKYEKQKKFDPKKYSSELEKIISMKQAQKLIRKEKLTEFQKLMKRKIDLTPD